MENDTLDVADNQGQEAAVKQLKTLAILTYVGSALWIIMFLIVLMAVETYFGTASKAVDTYGDSRAEEVMDEASGFMNIIRLVIVALMGICVLSMIGAYKMTKLQHTGFVLYAIGTGIFALLLLVGAVQGQGEANMVIPYLTVALSGMFIYLYSRHRSLMK
jgi:hypothetical protein